MTTTATLDEWHEQAADRYKCTLDDWYSKKDQPPAGASCLEKVKWRQALAQEWLDERFRAESPPMTALGIRGGPHMRVH